MTDEPWPSPPREPGPWAGGPPVAPAGSSSIPPLTPGPMAPPPGSTVWSPSAVGSTAGSSVYPGAPGPPSRNQDRAPAWVRALSAAVVLAVVAGGILLVTQKESQYPSEWDTRVAGLARWVEGARDLKFDHAVDVIFLTPEEYSSEATGDVSSDDDLEEEDRDAMQEAVGMLRALGLVEGEIDLTAANNTLADSATLAFYSPPTKTVYVRGTELTPALRVTLAHELVHVLQDQHFDLTRLPDLESGTATTLRAVAEGDATRIEHDYIEKKLSEDEQAAYWEEIGQSSEDVSSEIDEQVPPALTALFASPYVFGPRLVDYLFASDGTAAIDAALTDPPSEFALFDPVNNEPATHSAADQEEIPIDAPDGAETIDDGTFGATTWYLMLAARLDPSVALAATDGITADGYVNYRKDDTVCVAAVAKTDADKDMKELTEALKDWAAKSPEGSASVRSTDGTVILRSCDPGNEVKGLGSVSVELLLFAAVRTDMYVVLIDEGNDAELAACFSQGLVESFTVAEIVDPEFGSDAAAEQRLGQLARTCA